MPRTCQWRTRWWSPFHAPRPSCAGSMTSAPARDSAPAYREAATEMRRARERYEKEVWQSGAPDLVRSTMVDADGRFMLSDLPAGRWIVWATHSQFMDKRSP